MEQRVQERARDLWRGIIRHSTDASAPSLPKALNDTASKLHSSNMKSTSSTKESQSLDEETIAKNAAVIEELRGERKEKPPAEAE